MEFLAVNLAGGLRREKLHGREYLVAPMTLIRPGVLNGSKGPLYYPPDEIARDPLIWNHTPLVVEHPKTAQGFATARDPGVLNTAGVGLVLGARVEPNGDLKADGWFDVAALRRVDNGLLGELEAGKSVELSTGLFTDNEAAEGEVDGVTYTGIARRYRADHVALLRSGPGACSVADGCGVNNELSDSDLHKALQAEIAKRYGVEAFLIDVFAKTAVYTLGEELYQIGYAAKRKTGEVKLSDGGAVEVRRETNYKPVTNAATAANSKRGGKAMDEKEKAALVEFILTNCEFCGDGDREMVANLSDEKLSAWKADLEKAQQREAVANAARKGFTDPGGNSHAWNEEKGEWETKQAKPAEKKKPVTNAAKPQTAEEWLAAAPPEIRSAVQNAQGIELEEKRKLVERLTANVAEGDREAHATRLMGRTLDELRADVALLPPEREEPELTAHYAGQAGATHNSAGAKDRPAFGLPSEYLPADD